MDKSRKCWSGSGRSSQLVAVACNKIWRSLSSVVCHRSSPSVVCRPSFRGKSNKISTIEWCLSIFLRYETWGNVYDYIGLGSFKRNSKWLNHTVGTSLARSSASLITMHFLRPLYRHGRAVTGLIGYSDTLGTLKKCHFKQTVTLRQKLHFRIKSWAD